MPSLLLKKFLWSQFNITHIKWLSSKYGILRKLGSSPWNFKISAAGCIDWDQYVSNSVNSQTWSVMLLVFFMLVIQVEL